MRRAGTLQFGATASSCRVINLLPGFRLANLTNTIPDNLEL